MKQCKVCGKEAKIKSEPNRHACSPNGFNFDAKNEGEKHYNWYCSEEHQKQHQEENYAYWAELDRNASDSECFEHIKWIGKGRYGRCKITGKEFTVYPLQPSNNSGQPKECEEHFVLREKYKRLLV